MKTLPNISIRPSPSTSITPRDKRLVLSARAYASKRVSENNTPLPLSASVRPTPETSLRYNRTTASVTPVQFGSPFLMTDRLFFALILLGVLCFIYRIIINVKSRHQQLKMEEKMRLPIRVNEQIHYQPPLQIYVNAGNDYFSKMPMPYRRYKSNESSPV